MSQSNTLSITLPEDAVKFVRSRVLSGEYASESDVILDSLAALQHNAEEQELWERDVLVPAHDRLMANPSSALSLEEVERDLELSRAYWFTAR